MVDFGGWEMPLHYGSQIEEHHAVRRAAGLFDVSHMCAIDLRGARARPFLARLLANDVGRLQRRGKALYSCMLNDSGGVLDDLVAYFLEDELFRVVVNAGTRDRDLEWIRTQARAFGVEVTERADLALLAIQGPQARASFAALLDPADARVVLGLGRFEAASLGAMLVSRTGYTGEDGFEWMLPAAAALEWWQGLRSRGIVACGLGARDTLRLEAGLNLYGNDMDETTHPLESGLAWTVALAPPDRAFIGRPSLEAVLARGAERKLVGLLLEDRGVLRAHQPVLTDAGAGAVTSGTFSPTLQRSIALARVPAAAVQHVQVDIRGKRLRASIVPLPFVRHGRPLINAEVSS
jgi:aminomethyltransferase